VLNADCIRMKPSIRWNVTEIVDCSREAEVGGGGAASGVDCGGLLGAGGWRGGQWPGGRRMQWRMRGRRIKKGGANDSTLRQ
jgi:hypothetical protein